MTDTQSCIFELRPSDPGLHKLKVLALSGSCVSRLWRFAQPGRLLTPIGKVRRGCTAPGTRNFLAFLLPCSGRWREVDRLAGPRMLSLRKLQLTVEYYCSRWEVR